MEMRVSKLANSHVSTLKLVPSPTILYQTPGLELIVPQNPTSSKVAPRDEPEVVVPGRIGLALMQRSFVGVGGVTVGAMVGKSVNSAQ
jgi:hypothetical protein